MGVVTVDAVGAHLHGTHISAFALAKYGTQGRYLFKSVVYTMLIIIDFMNKAMR